MADRNTGKRKKMTKDTLPDGFSIPLALMDLLPVLFFGLSALQIGRMLQSIVFTLGASICLASGIFKVVWKMTVAVKKKNVRILSLQMRFLMPAGFIVMILGVILKRNMINIKAAVNVFFTLPSYIFFSIGIAGLIFIFVFMFTLDSSKARTNLIEEITNTISQAAFFIGLMLL
ncbi:MAG: hypothetical protein VZR00_06695 [Lachnospiraceae bacterium]|jgi:hypothetical protein|nr:hypothetical protein [Lachnospiraceae bacterium]MEE3461563.1 hypothetical protein [Lachnospiraceae bacterium]